MEITYGKNLEGLPVVLVDNVEVVEPKGARLTELLQAAHAAGSRGEAFVVTGEPVAEEPTEASSAEAEAEDEAGLEESDQELSDDGDNAPL